MTINDRRMQKDRNQRGIVIAEFLLAIGLLMIPAGFLMMVFPRYEAQKEFASSLARDVARTVAAEGSVEHVKEVARNATDNYGLRIDDIVVGSNQPGAVTANGNQIVIDISSLSSAEGDGFNKVRVTVGVRSPFANVPGISSVTDKTIVERYTEVTQNHVSPGNV